MPSGVFSVHTRQNCAQCTNQKCRCIVCIKYGFYNNGSPLCGLGSEEFPMETGCRWDSILQCAHYKAPHCEEGGL